MSVAGFVRVAGRNAGFLLQDVVPDLAEVGCVCECGRFCGWQK